MAVLVVNLCVCSARYLPRVTLAKDEPEPSAEGKTLQSLSQETKSWGLRYSLPPDGDMSLEVLKLSGSTHEEPVV